MATLYLPGKPPKTVEPKDGRKFTLEELYSHLDCTQVEFLACKQRRQNSRGVIYKQVGWIVVDEFGKYKKLQPNSHVTHVFYPGLIVGPALVAKMDEID